MTRQCQAACTHLALLDRSPSSAHHLEPFLYHRASNKFLIVARYGTPAVAQRALGHDCPGRHSRALHCSRYGSQLRALDILRGHQNLFTVADTPLQQPLLAWQVRVTSTIAARPGARACKARGGRHHVLICAYGKLHACTERGSSVAQQNRIRASVHTSHAL